MLKIPVPHFVTFYNGKEKMEEAVDECIEEDILADFFREHRDEVVDVSIYEYDEEGHMAIIREEGREEGRKEGYLNGREDGETQKLIFQIIRKVQKNKSLEIIASELEEDVAQIKPLYDAVVAAVPDYNIDRIMENIVK